MQPFELARIKPYSPSLHDDRLHKQLTPLTNQVNMPTVQVKGPFVTQNSPLSSLVVAVTNDSTHFAYLQRDGQAELARVAWFKYQDGIPAMQSCKQR